MCQQVLSGVMLKEDGIIDVLFCGIRFLTKLLVTHRAVERSQFEMDSADML